MGLRQTWAILRSQENVCQKGKKPTALETIFANYSCDFGLISSTYKELKKIKQ